MPPRGAVSLRWARARGLRSATAGAWSRARALDREPRPRRRRRAGLGAGGVVRTSAQTLRIGVPFYLLLLGLISMSVALFNLLPLLPLDGGNIVVSVVEGLRRRPVPTAVYQRLSMVGTVLILLITVIALSNDIGPSPH